MREDFQEVLRDIVAEFVGKLYAAEIRYPNEPSIDGKLEKAWGLCEEWLNGFKMSTQPEEHEAQKASWVRGMTAMKD